MLTPMALIMMMLIAALWYHGMQAKRYAISASRYACGVRNWQFLDQTAALSKIKLIYPKGGRLTLYRRYEFEYFDGNDCRQKSYVVLNGMHVVKVGLPVKTNVVSLEHYRKPVSAD